MALPAGYWRPLHAAGGEVRMFNPESLNRFGIRDHRKLPEVHSDEEPRIHRGGFNIADEYHGDGVMFPWPLVRSGFENSRASRRRTGDRGRRDVRRRHNFRHQRFFRLRKSGRQRTISFTGGKPILTGPGRNNAIKDGVVPHDLKHAHRVSIICAYFLPLAQLIVAVNSAAGPTRAAKSAIDPSRKIGRAAHAAGRAQPLPAVARGGGGDLRVPAADSPCEIVSG